MLSVELSARVEVMLVAIVSQGCTRSSLQWTLCTVYTVYCFSSSQGCKFSRRYITLHHYSALQSLIVTLDSVDIALQCVLFAGMVKSVCTLSSLHWTVSNHYSGQCRHSTFLYIWLQCVLFAGRVESDCSLSPLQDVWDCISLQSSGTQWSGIKKSPSNHNHSPAKHYFHFKIKMQ